MKQQSANSAVLSVRCAYHTSDGRQCRESASGSDSLCPQHHASHKQELDADRYLHLTWKYHDFQTAQGINHSLHNLYGLLAQNRISPRRAAVLAYINSLLLRTLPQIDADNAAGIGDPTKLPIELPAEHSTVPAKPAAEAMSAPVQDSVAGSNPTLAPDAANTWDASNPEPDPKKKPS
jgi:hypothetical protein